MKKLPETWRKRVELIYHTLIVLMSVFMCFGLGSIAFQGIGNERGTWALSTVSGMFGMVLIIYLVAFVTWGFKRLMAK